VSNSSYVIGLTGNIATGKSQVAQMLARRGAEHIDADRLAHQVMAQDTPAWQQIVEAFGRKILDADGEIDRKQLGAIVFTSEPDLARLEQIVHPAVIARTEERIANTEADVVVVEAIKLIESSMVLRLCDVLWVVTAPREAQIRRLMDTRGLSRDEAVLRIDAQPPQSDKVARADVVIDNSETLKETERLVSCAWNQMERDRAARRG
jgi:dephospho-CoA kinase